MSLIYNLTVQQKGSLMTEKDFDGSQMWTLLFPQVWIHLLSYVAGVMKNSHSYSCVFYVKGFMFFP